MNDYNSYGDDWFSEMNQFRKEDLISKLRDCFVEISQLQEKLDYLLSDCDVDDFNEEFAAEAVKEG